MSESTTVTVDELRQVTAAMFDWLEGHVGERVEIDVDPFWWIDAKQVYDPYRDPNGLTIGSVADSIEFLHRSVDADERIGYGLVWLSQVLRAVGDSVSPR